MAFSRRTQSGMINWYARYPLGDGTWVDELTKRVAGYPNTKPASEKLERHRKKEIAEGSFTGTRTLFEWLDEWTKRRSTREKLKEARAVRRHLLDRSVQGKKLGSFRLDEIGSRVVRQAVRDLVTEGKASPKYIRNIVGVLHTCFRSAVAEELCLSNPVVLDTSDLPRAEKKRMPVYSQGESQRILNHEYLDESIRMLFTVLLFTAERVGEGCGHIWGDIDHEARPLKGLWLDKQYDGKPLKGDIEIERPRWIPIHQELEKALTHWRVRWAEIYGREPADADPIVPNPLTGKFFTRSAAYQRGRLRFEWAGLEWKGQHACRRAFISMVRRSYPRKDVVERVTHNACGDTVDLYTSWEWEPLCEAVQALPLAFRNGTPWRTIRGPEDVGSIEHAAELVEARGIEPQTNTTNVPQTPTNPESDLGNAGSNSPTFLGPGTARGLVREYQLDAWALALAAESVGVRRAS